MITPAQAGHIEMAVQSVKDYSYLAEKRRVFRDEARAAYLYVRIRGTEEECVHLKAVELRARKAFESAASSLRRARAQLRSAEMEAAAGEKS